MCIPCGAPALDAAKTKQGTLQAEAVSTPGICGFIITILTAVLLDACIGTFAAAVLLQVVSDAFVKYAAGAVLGETFGTFAIKYPKFAVFGIGTTRVADVSPAARIHLESCWRVRFCLHRRSLLCNGDEFVIFFTSDVARHA